MKDTLNDSLIVLTAMFFGSIGITIFGGTCIGIHPECGVHFGISVTVLVLGIVAFILSMSLFVLGIVGTIGALVIDSVNKEGNGRYQGNG